MAVNYRDVEMLNSSMRDMGNAFRTSRLDNEAIKSRKIEDELRGKTLELAQGRDQRDAAGQVQAYLSGDDGGIVQYSGTPGGLDQVLSQAEAKGKRLRVVSAPQRKASIGTFTTQTPLGQFTFHLDDDKSVEQVMEMAKKIGASAKQQGEMDTKESRNFKQQQALKLAVSNATTPDEKRNAQAALDDFQVMLPKGKEPTDDTEKDLAFFKRERARALVENDTEKLAQIDRLIQISQPTKFMPVMGKRAMADNEITAAGPAAKPVATSAPAGLKPGMFLKRPDGKVRVKNAEGVKGWATVDPNNLPQGWSLSD